MKKLTKITEKNFDNIAGKIKNFIKLVNDPKGVDILTIKYLDAERLDDIDYIKQFGPSIGAFMGGAVIKGLHGKKHIELFVRYALNQDTVGRASNITIVCGDSIRFAGRSITIKTKDVYCRIDSKQNHITYVDMDEITKDLYASMGEEGQHRIKDSMFGASEDGRPTASFQILPNSMKDFRPDDTLDIGDFMFPRDEK